MNKQNKIISLLMSALIVFSLFSPAALKAEEGDSDPADTDLINETVGNEKKEDDDIVPSEG